METGGSHLKNHANQEP